MSALLSPLWSCGKGDGSDTHTIYEFTELTPVEHHGEPAQPAARTAAPATPPASLPEVTGADTRRTARGGNGRLMIRSVGRLADVFNDSNKTQYQYAVLNGIAPIHQLRDAYYTSRPVVHIRSNERYEVDKLEHSMPFLVPMAAELLDDIAVGFIDSLKSRGGSGYRIKVTSMLRTSSSVKRLRRVNINATDSSTHKFATTFDLSYTKFHRLPGAPELNSEDLKNLLAEVLYDLRMDGRCLVKFERMTGCFHVTVVKGRR